MKTFMSGNSAIRAMFEEGKKMAKVYGPENVYDFSLGNPSVEPPKEVNEAAIKILQQTAPNVLHGYPNNSGFEDVRLFLAQRSNRLHGTDYNERNYVITTGAAAALNIALKVILDPGDEVIVFAPYFGEYNNYVRNYDAVGYIVHIILIHCMVCVNHRYAKSLAYYFTKCTERKLCLCMDNIKLKVLNF